MQFSIRTDSTPGADSPSKVPGKAQNTPQNTPNGGTVDVSVSPQFFGPVSRIGNNWVSGGTIVKSHKEAHYMLRFWHF